MKTPKEVLINEINEDLITYLKTGVLSIKSFVQKMRLNIDNLYELLSIHFLLLPQVRKYILKLPQLIRKFRVSSSVYQVISNQAIKGKINWQNTIKERLRRNYVDKTLFVESERNKYYNTKESF